MLCQKVCTPRLFVGWWIHAFSLRRRASTAYCLFVFVIFTVVTVSTQTSGVAILISAQARAFGLSFTVTTGNVTAAWLDLIATTPVQYIWIDGMLVELSVTFRLSQPLQQQSRVQFIPEATQGQRPPLSCLGRQDNCSLSNLLVHPVLFSVPGLLRVSAVVPNSPKIFKSFWNHYSIVISMFILERVFRLCNI